MRNTTLSNLSDFHRQAVCLTDTAPPLTVGRVDTMTQCVQGSARVTHKACSYFFTRHTQKESQGFRRGLMRDPAPSASWWEHRGKEITRDLVTSLLYTAPELMFRTKCRLPLQWTEFNLTLVFLLRI